MRTISMLLLSATLLGSVAPCQRLISIATTGEVYEIDSANGDFTQVGTVPSVAWPVGELVWNPVSDRLYALSHTSTQSPRFYQLDSTSWGAAQISTLPSALSTTESAAWHAQAETMYVVDSTGELSKVNPTNGAMAYVGNTGVTSLQSLGYDSDNDQMYLCGGFMPNLYALDVNTGATTLIAPLTGALNCTSMTYDAANQRMLLMEGPVGRVRELNLSTGVATLLGSDYATNVRSLVYIPGSGTLVRDNINCSTSHSPVFGSPNIGHGVSFTIQLPTGIPVHGYGLTDVMVPFCGCTIGHDWLATEVGGTSHFNLPNDPTLVGLFVIWQGMDLFGTVGCANPQLALTDRVTLTVGS